MSATNNCSFIGRLVADPVLRNASESKYPMCTFRIAVDTGRGEYKSTLFLSVMVLGASSEPCAKYLNKGKECAVVGELEMKEVEKDGRKITYYTLKCFDVKFLSKSEVAGGVAKAILNDEELPF